MHLGHQVFRGFLLLCFLIGGLFSARGQQPSETQTVGVPWTGPPGVTETVSEMMARERKLPPRARGSPREPGPDFKIDRTHLPQNPNSPWVASWPATAQPVLSTAVSGTGPLAPQAVGTSFLGAQFSDTIGFVPPDSMADIGPNQIVVCVNGRIRTFTKAGIADGALSMDTSNFFLSVNGNNGVSDPRVRYDRISGRWFITMITVNTPNRVLIAVSSGPTISSGSSFTLFQFQHDLVGTTPNSDTGFFADYDTLGVDVNALYIGVNIFNGNTFQNTTGFVVKKASLLTGTLTVTAFRQLITGRGPNKHGPFTPHGVNNDDPNATEGYFIGVDDASFGLLDVRRVSTPGGVPSLSGNLAITVPSTDSPMGNVPAQGSTLNLDDLDDRLFATRMHNGSLWTAHNIEVNATGTANSSGGRDGSRWYEITNLSGTPTLRQSGTVFDSAASNPRSFWIPSCAMSGQGHTAFGSSVAGASEHAEIATAGRLAADVLGTMQAPTTAVTSTTSYNLNSGGSDYRWGDYSVVSVDPNDDMTMWAVQEYCNANNSWGVQVIQLKAPPPATPASASPSVVTQGVANVNIVVAGTSINGSGFFDPGVSFSNHISATVNGGGVTVNAVTYNNPTNITLNLTIAGGATASARTITVTNPDGQSATSASGILTIAGLSSTNFTLTVNKIGAGTGTVTSSPAGINCGGTCSASFASNTVVTLAASAGANSAFLGWSGGCSGTSNCVVTLSSNTTRTADFDALPVISAASISPGSPTTTNDLVATVTSTNDLDGDPITLAYQWQQSTNNVAFTNLTGQTASALGAALTAAGDYYRVVITPNDGHTNGAPFTTASVLVPLDADGNGINDDWEVQYFGRIGVDPNTDPDGDGFSNLQEFLAGTDPTNGAASFRITSIMTTGDDVLINWFTGIGKTNALQATAGTGDGSFGTNDFADIFTVTNTTSLLTNYLDVGAATNIPSRYYRVRLVP